MKDISISPPCINVKHKGFTVLQIVVAMVIFAILTGIAFLGANIYINQSNETRVKSDLTTFEVALHDYMLNDAAACASGKLTLSGINLYLTQENAVKESDLSNEVTADASKNDRTGISNLLDPWGHEYRILILNDRDRKTGDNEYGAQGKNRAFIYAYTAGKDGRGGEEDTKQDDAVLCVQYSDGEVYSKIYLPSDGSNQSITVPAYTYWNKDENGKHSVMKEDIFAVGTVDPAKAPGKESGSGSLSKNPIPEGGIYIIGGEGETVLEGNHGDTFPKKPQTGDVYWQENGEDSRLIYTYNRGGEYGTEWSVVADSMYYGYREVEILAKIAGKPVTSMYKAFENNESFFSAPKIPNSITNMREAFSGCTHLNKAPVIPGSVKDMTETFLYCYRLTGEIEINANPVNYEGCFAGTEQLIVLKGSSAMLSELTSYVAAPNGNVVLPYTGTNELVPIGCYYNGKGGDGVSVAFPDAPSVGDDYIDKNNGYIYVYGKNTETEWQVGALDPTWSYFGEIRDQIAGKPVTSMFGAFAQCTAMTIAPSIPSSITNIDSAFEGCTALISTPIIPNSVTNMSYAFAGCTVLTSATTIPSSVKDMSSAFYGCTALTGEIEINANPTNYENCFYNTVNSITLKGASKLLQELAYTSGEGNITVSN